MLDRDLANLYGVETRVLNQAVRRNIRRFPKDFMSSLTREEIMELSQFVTSSRIKHAPNVFAFTEQGVAILPGVLNSERAVQVNIAIMRAFVKLREMISSHRDLAKRLDDLEKKYDARFRVVFDAIRELMTPPAKPRRILLAEFFIAGFHYHEGMKPDIFRTLKESEALVLRREPDNPHDLLAIAIFTKGGKQLGYVPRTCNYSPALIADQDVRLCAEIAEIDPKADPWERVLVSLWQEV